MASTLLAPAEISPDDIQSGLSRFISSDRVLARPIDLIAFASDASFYRLIPRAVVQSQGVEEIRALFAFSRETRIPMTFRAAGTSLSGQSISDGLLVEVARNWREMKVEDSGRKIRLQPGVIGARANQMLTPYRRQDRARPRFDRHLHHRRNPGQQLQRHVLRRGAECLSHPAFDEVHACRRAL